MYNMFSKVRIVLLAVVVVLALCPMAQAGRDIGQIFWFIDELGDEAACADLAKLVSMNSKTRFILQ